MLEVMLDDQPWESQPPPECKQNPMELRHSGGESVEMSKLLKTGLEMNFLHIKIQVGPPELSAKFDNSFDKKLINY